MLPYRDSRLTLLALVVFFALALGYAFFETRGLLFGPSISVASGVSVVHDSFIVIEGHAARISSLSMNGRQIPVTESGDFKEPYLLSPGYNRIALDARDAYGRSEEKVLEIVYASTSSATSSLPHASSTAPSTP